MGTPARRVPKYSEEELREAFADKEAPPVGRYKWKQAFIMSKKMDLFILRVSRIS